eukprot:snap_masked-scaffold_6-processed-gene-19.0-mRNA-1 protein AED:1.00 eAED:1.00 QI:0/0/0/0/1/1/2/0/106
MQIADKLSSFFFRCELTFSCALGMKSLDTLYGKVPRHEMFLNMKVFLSLYGKSGIILLRCCSKPVSGPKFSLISLFNQLIKFLNLGLLSCLTLDANDAEKCLMQWT